MHARGSASGLGQRIGSNPDPAPQADSTDRDFAAEGRALGRRA